MTGRLLSILALRRSGPVLDPAAWYSVHDTNLRTGSTTVLLPFNASTGNRTIDWGDGVVEVVNTANPSHTYAADGIYTVKVSGGTTTRLGNVFNAGWYQTVTKVIQWGALAFTSFREGFRGCTQNVEVPTSIPTTVNDLQSMFIGASAFNQPINEWNTSNVTNMLGMFFGASAFNQSIGNWNTGKVTNMQQMFQGAIAFNQDISGWSIATVTTMAVMFSGASAFNQNLGSWKLRLAGVAMQNMLDSSGLSVENYSRTLIGWANYVAANSDTPASVTLGASGRKYNNTAYTTGLTYNDAASARAYLVGVPPGWTITDGGQA